MTDNYLAAKKEVTFSIERVDMPEHLYQGKIDVTELINFQEVATKYHLTEKEYERLIKEIQKAADLGLKAYFRTL